MNQSESIKELAAALSKAQGVMAPAAKDTNNPFFKTRYADLASIWEAARKPLADNGLAVCQTTSMTDGEVHLITTLMHTSGEWITGELSLPPTKRDPQGYGSAITYMRRYALAAIVGVSPEDDDGNDGSKKDKNPDSPPATTGKDPKPSAVESKSPSDKFAEKVLDEIKKCANQAEIDAVCAANGNGLVRLKEVALPRWIQISDAISARADELRFPAGDREPGADG